MKKFTQTLTNHLSVRDTNLYCGYDHQYLQRLLRNGKLMGIKIGQIWLIDKGALDADIRNAQKQLTDNLEPKFSIDSISSSRS